MQMLLKIILSVAIILAATTVGKKLPSIAGLVGVMPLTGALVFIWMYLENKGDPEVMQDFTKGAIWGILPTMLFFIVILLCLKKHLSLPVVLVSSFGAWLVAAIIHHWFLK